ncbi:2-aminoethanethiol dioxygenase-like [Octopus sinensis]|uniref:2-aminoethanethiol dioxygenase-like n=1 Tax=Octopus sinensis TaxID=2607531 RepID=A0A6P7U689_9MOLL|nr:2-aminoethanethiol dioxygenase-like [Octopus sinensis]
MSLLQLIGKAAYKCILSSNKKSDFQELKNLFSRVQKSDLNFTACSDYDLDKYRQIFLQIFEDTKIMAFIVILAENARIPLHDHHQMNGFVKIIEGCAKVETFTPVKEGRSPSEIICRRELEGEITSETKSCLTLSPNFGNIHQLSAINGPCAFFDILFPPYESDFFRLIKLHLSGSKTNCQASPGVRRIPSCT